jgi:pimeloyl-ACP methyl ester carboxylesterase
MPRVELRGGELDGLSLHYLVEGGGGQPVILVHGLGGFAEYWRETIPALAVRSTVYALDLPGFGRSAKPRVPYGPIYLAGALRAFMESLGIGQASIVGHSLGGAVAVTFALMHPLRIDRLALLGAVVPGFTYRLSWLPRLALVPGLGEALAACRSPRAVKACLARCFYAPSRAELDFLVDSFSAERMNAAARAAVLACARGLRTECVERRADYQRALATLEMPVLMIHGRQDRVVPATHCAEVTSGLPRATVRWIDRCGHFPHLEHPSLVNGWLDEFLAGRTAPR